MLHRKLNKQSHTEIPRTSGYSLKVNLLSDSISVGCKSFHGTSEDDLRGQCTSDDRCSDRH
jgi:hypothetical protein